VAVVGGRVVVRGGGRDALLASADSSATPDWRRLDLTQAVERAARSCTPTLPGREVHVLSDLQRTALATGRAEVPRGVRVLALAAARGRPAAIGESQARTWPKARWS